MPSHSTSSPPQAQAPFEARQKCEKEKYVSQRHEMISSVLQLPSTDSDEEAEEEKPVEEAEAQETKKDLRAAYDGLKKSKTDGEDPLKREIVSLEERTLQPGAVSVTGLNPATAEEAADATTLDLEQGQRQGRTMDELGKSNVATAIPIEAQILLQEEEQKAQMELQIWEQIKRDSVEACQVVTENKSGWNDPCKWWVLVALIVILALGLGLGLGLGLTSKEDAPTDQGTDSISQETLGPDDVALAILSTLEQVRQRGYVRCGVTEFGFVQQQPNGSFTGFNVQQCRSMALAALGNPDLYQIVLCDHYTRFSFLANGTIDIMTESATHTLGRDVWVDTFQTGFTFTVPYFYSGLAFAGNNPDLLDCADALDSFYGSCRQLKICVLDGSTHVEIMTERIQGSAIVPYNETQDLLNHLWQGICNVAAGEPLFLVKVKEWFFNGTATTTATTQNNDQWKIGSTVVSKEPLATVTRHGDPEWSALANLVVQTFILAEAHNVTKHNAHKMEFLFPIDSANKDTYQPLDLPSIMISLVEEFGNYGDLYQGEIQQQIPRDNALNRPYQTNNASTGLLYAAPFGNLLGLGPGPLPNGTLNAIYQRGYLRCGVHPSRGSGLVDFNGRFDVELCRAIAAALFTGDKDNVQFVDLEEGLLALSEGDVDVVAGAHISLQKEFFGFSFSTPYFYDKEDAFAFQTNNDDHQWSSFVDGIVLALLYAEEHGITSSIAGDMPVVTLFGEGLKQMFRDCVASVGSYAELYNNTLQEYIPREGPNRLNEDYAGPQMFPFPVV